MCNSAGLRHLQEMPFWVNLLRMVKLDMLSCCAAAIWAFFSG